ncbi:60S ribosomal protein L25 [Polyrhizophydium stewartii]|uniref:60S ribosomal protein L25 n=1 Tax=Polyrhizophydium stewartii TaxID=2732419 RepID=A0ABR4N2R8_9FUNG
MILRRAGPLTELVHGLLPRPLSLAALQLVIADCLRADVPDVLCRLQIPRLWLSWEMLLVRSRAMWLAVLDRFVVAPAWIAAVPPAALRFGGPASSASAQCDLDGVCRCTTASDTAHGTRDEDIRANDELDLFAFPEAAALGLLALRQLFAGSPDSALRPVLNLLLDKAVWSLLGAQPPPHLPECLPDLMSIAAGLGRIDVIRRLICLFQCAAPPRISQSQSPSASPLPPWSPDTKMPPWTQPSWSAQCPHCPCSSGVPPAMMAEIAGVRRIAMRTVFDIAGRAGRRDVIEFLCMSGIAEHACIEGAVAGGHTALVEWMREQWPLLSPSRFAIQTALRRGHTDVVWNLLGVSCAAARANLDVPPHLDLCIEEAFDDAQDTCAQHGQLLLLQYVVRHRIGTPLSFAAFELAAENGHTEAAEWLLQHGASCDLQDAINSAAWNGHLRTVQMLAERNGLAVTEAAARYAATRGHVDAFRWIAAHLAALEHDEILLSPSRDGSASAYKPQRKRMSYNTVLEAARNGHFFIIDAYLAIDHECSVLDITKLSRAAASETDTVKKAAAAKKAALKGTSTVVRKIRTKVTFHKPKTLALPRAPKYVRKSVPRTPRLDEFKVIKYPLNTESAMKKIEGDNTLVFICDVRANKRQIKAAVKKLYEAEAAKINTLIRPDGTKKAYVRLVADTDALDVANKIGFI